MNMKETQRAMVNEEMMSLYDYLNHAAGAELGKQVWHAAKAKGVPVTEKEVHTKSYTGRILMYPESFLREYFGGKQNELPF